MQPHMSTAEHALLTSLLRSSRNYLEFGSGGSTYRACQLVGESVTSIDSSQAWLNDVALACEGPDCPIKPTLAHVDIGPIGDWGMPTDMSTKDRWPSYYQDIWEKPSVSDTDLYLVDGRFRVACFMQTLLNCRSDALIMIHDFSGRAHYHIVREVAREVAQAEELSVFMPRPGQSHARIRDILSQYRFERN